VESKRNRTLFFIDIKMVVHLIALAVPAVVVGTALWHYTFFSWHPICLSIAYGFLMSQGILLFSSHSSLIPNATRSKKVNYHAYILLTMLAIIYVGQTVIYLVKESNGKAHFTTWHGVIGLMTVMYTTIQVMAGVFVKYAHMVKLPKSLPLIDLKLYHGASGCTLSILSCVTLILGLSSNWFVDNVNEYVRGLCMVAVVILGLTVLNHAVGLATNRMKRSVKK